MTKNKILIFHPIIAPYRIDFFNDMASKCNATIYLLMKKFNVFNNYDSIVDQFKFTPQYVFENGDESNVRLFSKQYWKILDKENPDIVLTSEFGACPLMVILHKKLFKKKYQIITMCDDSGDMLKTATLRHKIFRHICSSLMDNIIVVSPDVKTWFMNKYRKGIYFPIIRDETRARKEYSDTIVLSNQNAQKYDLLNKRVFMFVGRLAPEKNIALLIKSFAKVKTENDKLVIIGDGPEREELEELSIKTNTKILFTGRIEGTELMSWYNIADVFILPSTLERFGAVTNEALIAGCYSLISTMAGSCCLIKNNINGKTFSPNEEHSLETAIKCAQSKVEPHKDKIVLKDNLMSEPYKDLFDTVTRLLNAKE